MSEFKNLILKNFGIKGLKIYNLIDGKKTAEEIMKEGRVDEQYIIGFFQFLEEHSMLRLKKPTSSSNEGISAEEYYYLKKTYGSDMAPLDKIKGKTEYTRALFNLNPDDGKLILKKIKGENLTGDEEKYIAKLLRASTAREHGWGIGNAQITRLYAQGDAPDYVLDNLYDTSIDCFNDRQAALRIVHAYLLIDGKKTDKKIMDETGITPAEYWFLIGYGYAEGILKKPQNSK